MEHCQYLVFFGLDPKKTKRKWIEASLEAETINWRRFLWLRFRSYPESGVRADVAMRTARSVPEKPVMRFLKRLLLRWQYNWSRSFFESAKQSGNPVALVWNGLNSSRRVWADAAKDAGCATLFYELAPFPNCLTVDPQGVNFANSLPREMGPYMTWLSNNPGLSGCWEHLVDKIAQRVSVAKAELQPENLPPLSGKFIFVPLQFQGDSQLRLFGRNCRTVEETIDAVCAAAQHLPTNWHVRLKEHPSDKRSFTEHLAKVGAGLPVYIDNSTDTFEQVRASQTVCTVNSSVGLEALVLGKPVIVMGDAFWALPGLVGQGTDARKLAELFSNPWALCLDPVARDAFFSFLVSEYYPTIRQCGLAWQMPEVSREKVKARILSPILE